MDILFGCLYIMDLISARKVERILKTLIQVYNFCSERQKKSSSATDNRILGTATWKVITTKLPSVCNLESEMCEPCAGALQIQDKLLC